MPSATVTAASASRTFRDSRVTSGPMPSPGTTAIRIGRVALRFEREKRREELAAAGVVAQVAVSEIGKDLDYYRLTRQFFEYTSEDERLRFLDALFAVTIGDGHASEEEIEEIRTISHGLLLSHDQFIAAKLKVPRDQRTNA